MCRERSCTRTASSPQDTLSIPARLLLLGGLFQLNREGARGHWGRCGSAGRELRPDERSSSSQVDSRGTQKRERDSTRARAQWCDHCAMFAHSLHTEHTRPMVSVWPPECEFGHWQRRLRTMSPAALGCRAPLPPPPPSLPLTHPPAASAKVVCADIRRSTRQGHEYLGAGDDQRARHY
jgi:hypothetical protein